MKKISFILFSAAFIFSVFAQKKIPTVTGITATDCNEKQWNIDELLNEGKILWIHQAFSG